MNSIKYVSQTHAESDPFCMNRFIFSEPKNTFSTEMPEVPEAIHYH